jgi:hypothetical protein
MKYNKNIIKGANKMMDNSAMNMIENAVLENDISKFAKTLDMIIFMNEVYMFQIVDTQINIDVINNLRERISKMIFMSDELFDLRNRAIVLENKELFELCNELRDNMHKHTQDLRSFYM